MKRILLAILLTACTTANAWQLDRVIDGDTVSLQNGSQTVRVRLACIDAPEKQQRQGRRATQMLDSMLDGRQIEMQTDGGDRYGRTVAYLSVDGHSVNLAMTRSGWAWTYTKYCKRPDYYAAEAAARFERVGVWADSDPIAPWEYRRMQREGR